MKKIGFEVHHTKLAQDCVAQVPRAVVDKGEKDIVEYLYKTGLIDNALDYAESQTRVFIFNQD